VHTVSVYHRGLTKCSAVTPVYPLPQENRMRAAAVITPVLLASWVINANIVFRFFTFVVGVGIFGDPILARAFAWFTRREPDWKYTWHIAK
jgi:hypothetical protein